MTELLKNVFEDINNEQPVEISKQLVEDWLDNLIVTRIKILDIIKQNEKYRHLYMGELDVDKGDYDITLTMCSDCNFLNKDIQLWNSIRKVAEILKVELIEDSSYSEYNRLSFDYNGWEIFELEDK